VPIKTPDPFVDNETKGTRMPDYTKLAGERDVFGELGWIPNFDIKKSKNNIDRHNNYREFFDAPKDYHNEFTSGSVNNTEFFRANSGGLEGSVGSKTPAHEGSQGSRFNQLSASKGGFGDTRRSLNQVERMSYSATRG